MTDKKITHETNEIALNDYEFLRYCVDDELVISTYYKVNPIKGTFINIFNKFIFTSPNKNGDIKCHIAYKSEPQLISYVHKIMYFHVHGKLQHGMLIYHVDENKKNNSIDNLKLETVHENHLKSAKKRNYAFASKNHENAHKIHVKDCNTNKEYVIQSLYSCKNYFGVNPGLVKMCCENKNNVKSGLSKINNHKLIFSYTTEPLTLIGKKGKYFYISFDGEMVETIYV
jgi:hypothetical protein